MAVIDSSSVWREILGAKDYSTQIRLTDGPIDVLQLEATNVAELRPNQLSHSIASLRGNNDAGAPSELIQIKRSRIGKPLPSRSMAVTILTACVELSPGPHLAPCPRGSFLGLAQPTNGKEGQPVAAAILVNSLDEEVNPRRANRPKTINWQTSGRVTPVSQ
jgi:hypothetical protein